MKEIKAYFVSGFNLQQDFSSVDEDQDGIQGNIAQSGVLLEVYEQKTPYLLQITLLFVSVWRHGPFLSRLMS